MATEAQRISVLYLDDESSNLSSFKANFRRLHRVNVANSADEAYQILEKEEPHIIIADQRMPDITGVEFFERVKVTHPDPVRILLTAYTSSQTVIEAINKGQIDRYMMKPWNTELMNSTLIKGFSMYQARVALRLKNDELERANAELNSFVYSVSHDLRAPLMSLLGLIDLLQEQPKQEEQSQFLELMEKSVHKMDRYIQTTLEYYRNLKAELSVSQVDSKELIEEIIDSMRAYNSVVGFKYETTGSTKISTDRIRLKVILNNLISNAVKYGNKGSGEYLVEIESRGLEDGMEFKVRDYGKGIAEDKIPKIFDMFFQGSESQDNRSTGLGLYLVKEAIKRIKGTISVESSLGSGTTFTIFIPTQPNE
jgi:signal transduction histidine kinase